MMKYSCMCACTFVIGFTFIIMPSHDSFQQRHLNNKFGQPLSSLCESDNVTAWVVWVAQQTGTLGQRGRAEAYMQVAC